MNFIYSHRKNQRIIIIVVKPEQKLHERLRKGKIVERLTFERAMRNRPIRNLAVEPKRIFRLIFYEFLVISKEIKSEIVLMHSTTQHTVSDRASKTPCASI